ncbi:MAG: polysaccharide pyruvyl transferase family protein [Acidobacteria bacterium]|nr:polysaccharide pyruvyl transferase family protein [Acidobacteriota bacterium]
MFRVFIYRRTFNLGDAMQTVALTRLLGCACAGVYRDEPMPPDGAGIPLIANGWLGATPCFESAFFAGVHIARRHNAHVEWLRRSPHTIGARDPFTAMVLRGITPVETVGCATLTFDRYGGLRHGRYSIDAPAPNGVTELTQDIGDIPWSEQWRLAVERLDLLRRAEIVYTSRLHAVLPCLAFGTPVVFPLESLARITGRERLSILQELPFAFGEAMTADATPLAARYLAHLEQITGKCPVLNTPAMPAPLTE